ncbi:MAG: STAS domain-containing protein [Phycisphaerales bacterium]|nr:STAS domain-containing protein [Phycisphaerales bacterium]MCH2154256.1 STAS domain-containing protein [Phycisphaerales bacterium]
MDEQANIGIQVDRQGDAIVVRPQGDIDLASSPGLRARLRELIEEAKGRIVVDLSEVPYMDSSGVATLVELLQSCRRAELELFLCQLNERVLSVFQIARLDGVFTIKESLEEAIGA